MVTPSSAIGSKNEASPLRPPRHPNRHTSAIPCPAARISSSQGQIRYTAPFGEHGVLRSRDIKTAVRTPSAEAPAVSQASLAHFKEQSDDMNQLPDEDAPSTYLSQCSDTGVSAVRPPRNSVKKVRRKPVPVFLDFAYTDKAQAILPASSPPSIPVKSLRRVKRVSLMSVNSLPMPAKAIPVPAPPIPTLTLTSPSGMTVVLLRPTPSSDGLMPVLDEDIAAGDNAPLMSEGGILRYHEDQVVPEQTTHGQPSFTDLDAANQTTYVLDQCKGESDMGQLVDVDLHEITEVDLGDDLEAAQSIKGSEKSSTTIGSDYEVEDLVFYQWSPKDGIFSPLPHLDAEEVACLPLETTKIKPLPRTMPKRVVFVPSSSEGQEKEEGSGVIDRTLTPYRRPMNIPETEFATNNESGGSNPALALECAPFDLTSESDDDDDFDAIFQPNPRMFECLPPISSCSATTQFTNQAVVTTPNSAESGGSRTLSDSALPVRQGLVSKLVAHFEEKAAPPSILATPQSSGSIARQSRSNGTPPALQRLAVDPPKAWKADAPTSLLDVDLSELEGVPSKEAGDLSSNASLKAEKRMKEEEERMWQDEDAWIYGSTEEHPDNRATAIELHEVDYNGVYGEEDQCDSYNDNDDDDKRNLAVVWDAGRMAQLYRAVPRDRRRTRSLDRMPTLLEGSEPDVVPIVDDYDLGITSNLSSITELDDFLQPFPSPYRRELPSCCRSHWEKDCNSWEVQSAPGCLEDTSYTLRLPQSEKEVSTTASPLVAGSLFLSSAASTPMTTYSALTPAMTNDTLPTPATTPSSSPLPMKNLKLESASPAKTSDQIVNQPQRRSTANIPYDSQSILFSTTTISDEPSTWLESGICFEPRNGGRALRYRTYLGGSYVCDGLQDGVEMWAAIVRQALSKDTAELARFQDEEDNADTHKTARPESEDGQENEDSDWNDGLELERGVTWIYETPPAPTLLSNQGEPEGSEQDGQHQASLGPDQSQIDWFQNITATVESNRRTRQARRRSLDCLLDVLLQRYYWENPLAMADSFGQAAARLAPVPTTPLFPFPTSKSGLTDGHSQNAAVSRAIVGGDSDSVLRLPVRRKLAANLQHGRDLEPEHRNDGSSSSPGTRYALDKDLPPLPLEQTTDVSHTYQSRSRWLGRINLSGVRKGLKQLFRK